MSKTGYIILTIVVLLVIIYFAYVKLIKNDDTSKSTDTLPTINCSAVTYWALPTPDKLWCKRNGLAPAYVPNVQTDISPNPKPVID